ncbi:helicase associated domain-containing protein [Streptomyces sp. KR55]|uniref:helicase associated domain-containing protein n=1 Tax=Streptomyces sp. KR55 TaxID=3457425 RepID=UPI003FD0488D
MSDGGFQRNREHTVWQGLMDGQRERLEVLGITSLPAPPETSVKARKGGSAAFERGLEALAAVQAAGSLTVPRGHVETIVVDGEEHAVKLGVFLSNTKTRRAKLTPEQRAALTQLGLNWAAA